MPVYVEFPTDPVINVRWKKKNGNGGPPPDEWQTNAGAFQNGILHGLGPGGVYVLSYNNMYNLVVDGNPNRHPLQPYRFFPCFADYQWFMPDNLPPYVWFGPDYWTLEYHVPVYDFPTRILEYRNINVQAFPGSGVEPDAIHGDTAIIYPNQAGEKYDPLIVCQAHHFADWVTDSNPHVLVQAVSEHTTYGSWWHGTDNDPDTPAACMAMLPPQPGPETNWRVPTPYPVYGFSNEPVRPPSGARRRTEIRRPPGPLPERRFELEA